MNEKTITLTLEQYGELYDAYIELQRLKAAGVDNWEGYHIGLENEDEEDEE